MIQDQLPALLVVIPLLTAPVCFLLRHRSTAVWGLSTAVAWLTLFISLGLWWQVRDGDTISYAFGNWAPPWGIEYVVDRLNVLILLIVSGIATVILSGGRTSVENEIQPDRQGLLYTNLLLCLAGLLGICVTGDAFNLFVLLEISSLSSYALISLGRDRRALTAAFQYLIMGTIGATFILIGVGILYMLTGTLNMADLAAHLDDLHRSRAAHTAYGFLIIGIGLKLAMFPLHLWLPNAYAYAPSIISAFLAACATKVAVYIMVRYLFTIFGPDFAFSTMHIQWLFIPVGISAVLFTSIVALFQHDLKRMLAFSSVAQVGYMLVGLGLANVSGLTAALMHVFNHALIKGALFLALGAMCYRIGNPRIENIHGLAKRMPWTMAAFVGGGLSLIGVPLTAGFISKWYLILAAVERGWWPVAVVVVISSLIAVIYVWRVVERAYLHPAPGNGQNVAEAPMPLLISAWVLVLANIGFGIHPGMVNQLASAAAHELFGGFVW